MSNINRGEVSLPVGEKTYTLHFSVNAICELEDAAGTNFGAFIDQAESMGLRGIRILVWAGLRDRHDEVSMKDAGDIVEKAGLELAATKAMEAFSAAFPDVGEVDESPENPPKAKAKRNG